MLTSKLSEQRIKFTEEIELLTRDLSEKNKLCDQYKQEAVDQKGENTLTKRKYEMSLRVKQFIKYSYIVISSEFYLGG